MVLKGRFEIQLVDAETKTRPFKEFVSASGDRHYCEAEAGLEYFLKVKIHEGEGPRSIYVSFEIDGKEHDITVTRTCDDEPDFIGATYTSLTEELQVMKALRFETPVSSTPRLSRQRIAASALLGSVVVTFAKAVIRRKRARDYFEMEEPDFSPKSTRETRRPTTAGGGTKMLRSGEGSKLHIEQYGYPSESYQGKVLERITINYCTALGLVEVGILPSPPLWEYARLQAPRGDEEVDPAVAALIPSKVEGKPVVVNGEVIIPAKICDLFDITHLDPAGDSPDDTGEESREFKKEVGVIDLLDEFDDEEEVEEERVGSDCLDLKQLKISTSLASPVDEYEKAIDQAFVQHYHGMPKALFGMSYKRDAIWEQQDGTILPKKTRRRILERIVAWEKAIVCLQILEH